MSVEHQPRTENISLTRRLEEAVLDLTSPEKHPTWPSTISNHAYGLSRALGLNPRLAIVLAAVPAAVMAGRYLSIWIRSR